MQPGGANEVPTLTVSPDTVDLFLFSAAVGLSHRIHYDLEYARTEGLERIPVHGPLQGAYLSEMVSRWARDHAGRLTSLRIRHKSPAFAGDELLCTGKITARGGDGIVSVEIELTSGETVCTAGSAEVSFGPAAGLS